MGKKIDETYEELLALATHYYYLAEQLGEAHDIGAAEAAMEALKIVMRNRG